MLAYLLTYAGGRAGGRAGGPPGARTRTRVESASLSRVGRGIGPARRTPADELVAARLVKARDQDA